MAVIDKVTVGFGRKVSGTEASLFLTVTLRESENAQPVIDALFQTVRARVTAEVDRQG